MRDRLPISARNGLITSALLFLPLTSLRGQTPTQTVQVNQHGNYQFAHQYACAICEAKTARRQCHGFLFSFDLAMCHALAWRVGTERGQLSQLAPIPLAEAGFTKHTTVSYLGHEDAPPHVIRLATYDGKFVRCRSRMQHVSFDCRRAHTGRDRQWG
jgi:hypothetical protein